MASKKKQKDSVERMHMSRTLKEICEADQMRRKLEGIPIGKMLMIPSELSDMDEGRKRKSPKSMFRVKFKVVGKNRHMLICERNNGTRECFTFGDLVILQKKYGGLIDGESE